MDVKTKEAMRNVSHYIANHFTRGRQKWFASIKIYTTEMNAKPVFDCLLGAFRFGELLQLDLLTVPNRMFFFFFMGNSATLHCTTQIATFNSTFYKQCFDAWSHLNNNIPLLFQEVANEIIWNNKFLCVDKKSVFRRDLFSIGLLKIGDLISGNSTVFSFMNLLLNPEQSFFVMSIIDSIPTHWRTVVKEASFFPIIFPVSDASTITTDGNSFQISDVSSKQIYRQFQAKKQEVPTAQKKLADKYPHSAVDWEKVYSLSFCSSMESKLREFQYKILNRIVFTN